MDPTSRLPIEVELFTRSSPGAAAEALRDHIEARSSIEDEPGPQGGRKLTGTVTGARVDLAVRPPRKGFQVEFHGSLERAASGAELRGTIDISDHRQLRMFLTMVAAIGVLVALAARAFGIRDASNGAPINWPMLAFAIAVAGGTVLGTIWLAADIERSAADDARHLAAFLRRAYDAPVTSPSSRPRDIHRR